MEIRSEDYHIVYNPDTATIICSGLLRLQGDDEYAPIIQLLNDVADRKSEKIMLDMRELRFLNSPGLNMFFQFINRVCQQKSRLVIRGARHIPWHNKSFENLKRLVSGLSFEIE